MNADMKWLIIGKYSANQLKRTAIILIMKAMKHWKRRKCTDPVFKWTVGICFSVRMLRADRKLL